LFSTIAQHGLQLPALHLPAFHLPGLSLVSPLGAHPVLSQVAGALGQAGLGHLFPLVAAGAASGSTSAASTTAAVQPAASAVTTSLPSVPSGHVVTISGPVVQPVQAPAAQTAGASGG
jgi:hypothetical protein